MASTTLERILRDFFDKTGKEIVMKLMKDLSGELGKGLDEQCAKMRAECNREFEEKATRLISEQEALGNKRSDLKTQESALECRSAELDKKENEFKAQLHVAAVKMQQAEAREANVDIFRNVLLRDQEELKAQREAFKAEQETLAAAKEKMKKAVAVLEHDLQFAKEELKMKEDFLKAKTEEVEQRATALVALQQTQLKEKEELKAKEELLKVKAEEIEGREEAVTNLETQLKEKTAQLVDKSDLEGGQASGSKDLDVKGSSLNLSHTKFPQVGEQVCDYKPQKEWISLHEFLQRLPGGVQEEAEKLSKIAELVINRGKAAEVHVKVTQLQEITVGVKKLPSSDISPLVTVTETGSDKKKSLRHLASNLVRAIRGARSGSQCSASQPPQP